MLNQLNSSQSTPSQAAAFIGLDRSDRTLDICLQTAEGGSTRCRIDSAPESVAAWIGEVRARFEGRPVALCLEQPAAALLSQLMRHTFISVYAINPVTLSRFREAFATSRAKCDASDAAYLMELARDHCDKLTLWRPNDAPTRAVCSLVEARRKAVDMRTQLSNRLKAHLKSYFPQALELAGDELHTILACDFLTKWPCLQDVKKSRGQTLYQFYIAHNSRRKDVIAKRLELIKNAVAVCGEEYSLLSDKLTTGMIAGQLKELTAAIARFDVEIEKALESHTDAFIFASLPGAGAVHSARLLAAFGSERDRFADAAAMQNFSGIAPVIKSSGKIRLVQRRYACPRFLHQSFIEYSSQSVMHCGWAKAFYQQQKQKGKGHFAAVRALAFKWIRILFRCWQDKRAYDDAKYLAALKKRNHKLWEEAVALA